MRSFGGIWETVVEPTNLHAAMLRAARGKRGREPVARFLAAADVELAELRAELVSGSYCPQPYFQFRVRDPKPRTISCAAFRDRVVHHALCDVCGPLIERRFIEDSFACRVGKGTHRAVLRAQTFCRRYTYVLKTDIRAFFDSVRHDICEALLRELFREDAVIGLWNRVLRHPVPGRRHGLGLPIGNLTSQWLANLYLDELDHLVKERWRFRGYVRYMDDLLLWADNKDDLWWAEGTLKSWLGVERGLQLKPSATRLAPCRDGVAFLGMRIFPGCLRLQRARYRRLQRLVANREAELCRGLIGEDAFIASIRAAVGIPAFFGMRGLVKCDVDL